MEKGSRKNIEYAGRTRWMTKTLKPRLETYLFILNPLGPNPNQPLESHFVPLPQFSFESVILEHRSVLVAILELIQEEVSEQAWCGIRLQEPASSSN